MPTEISSPLHLRTLLGSHTYLIIDFYATWCPPCKTIAPFYDSLSTTYSSNNLAFAKVNVDDQREIAAIYGIQAMPTFLVLKGDQVVETIKGANPPALKKVVEGIVAEVGKAPAAAEKPVEKPAEKKETEGLSMAERLGIKFG